jgi:hypothetical protein
MVARSYWVTLPTPFFSLFEILDDMADTSRKPSHLLPVRHARQVQETVGSFFSPLCSLLSSLASLLFEFLNDAPDNCKGSLFSLLTSFLFLFEIVG